MKLAQIHTFFENPKGFFASLVQAVIFLFILASVVLVIIESRYHDLFLWHKTFFEILNLVILGTFTVEYVLRLSTAPKKRTWVRKPLNVIDFFAIAPNYVELLLPFFIETTQLRAIRIIRLLRFMRVLRALRLFRYGVLLRKIFQYQNTILEAITPILSFFILLKGAIWILEANRLWLAIGDLGELFAIIGFALGIILSQKVGVAYDKFVHVEEAIIRLYGNLRSLTLILDKAKPELGTRATKEWVKTFLSLLQNPKANNFAIHDANGKLFEAISQVEKMPADITNIHIALSQDAAFCLSKKVRITPKAYDTLLHQATMLYLGLITVFISGLSGVISVIVATYILYGMYHLTQDLDSILGGEFTLIDIDISELKYLAEN